jgi:hypothetical protein
MRKHAKFLTCLLVVAAVLVTLALTGCDEEDTAADRTQIAEKITVSRQDALYAKSQPVPFFNYSIPRDLWIQFYKATTSGQVRTWSCEVSDYGTPVSEIYESIGYPIPMDTQLTNPQKLMDNSAGSNPGTGAGVVPQSEPNGLYTSPNTNATIIMVADEAGKVVPLYSEHKVQSWPFPVKWDATKRIFVRAGEASLQLSTSGE